MFDKLSMKLFMPVIVGNLLLVIVLALFDELSKASLIGLVVVFSIIQLLVLGFNYQRQLGVRFAALAHYLEQVISTETAPEAPLKDNNTDMLALITNELAAFIEHLAKVLDEIRAEARSLRHGVDELAAQIAQSDHGVRQSSSQIQALANAIEQVAQTSGVLSNNTAQVNATTSSMVNLLSQGKQSSDTSQQTIATFAQEVQEMATDLSALQEECVRIGTVLDVIRGIAEQTNLLALNAAIEAARAGEQGRGFAVVADEVRALAHRTQESTVEIQSMVEGLQTKSNNAVQAIDRGQSLTEQSISHTQQVADAFEQIALAFTEVDQLTAQIADGTEEQQQSTEQMHQNVNQVVKLSSEVQQRFAIITEQANAQKQMTREVDTTLTKICV